jgi:hypothetical protein
VNEITPATQRSSEERKIAALIAATISHSIGPTYSMAIAGAAVDALAVAAGSTSSDKSERET